MAPIAHLLEKKSWPYRIIDLSQHGSITGGIVNDFNLRPEIIYFNQPGESVTSYLGAAKWLTLSSAQLLLPASKLKSRYVKNLSGVALIHGDTLSTWLGLQLAKRINMPIGLIEAGLTSRKLFSPFPEEIVRRHAESKVQYLFAPDAECEARLLDKNVRGKVINTYYNTGYDALSLISKKFTSARDHVENYTVCTLHRLETLSNPIRLRNIITYLISLAAHLPPIHFFLHEPTQKALKRYGLYEPLKNSSIILSPLLSYAAFMEKLYLSRAILTDGGSIQEEASYLNKPCLVLRDTTERPHGLGSTAQMCAFELTRDREFLLNVASKYTNPICLDGSLAASQRVLDAVNA